MWLRRRHEAELPMQSLSASELLQCRFSSSDQLPDFRFECFERSLLNKPSLRHETCFGIQNRNARDVGYGVIIHDIELSLVQPDDVECSVLPISEKYDYVFARPELWHTRNPDGLCADGAAHLSKENSAAPVAFEWIVDDDGDIGVNHPLFISSFHRFHTALHDVVRGCHQLRQFHFLNSCGE